MRGATGSLAQSGGIGAIQRCEFDDCFSESRFNDPDDLVEVENRDVGQLVAPQKARSREARRTRVGDRCAWSSAGVVRVGRETHPAPVATDSADKNKWAALAFGCVVLNRVSNIGDNYVARSKISVVIDAGGGCMELEVRM